MAQLPPYNKSVTLDDKIEELKNELRYRERLFPEWSSGPNPKMKPDVAAKQIAVMKAILRDYENLKAKEGVQVTLF
jgi:hypothetical protein